LRLVSDAGEVRLVDWDRAANADPLEDLGSFLVEAFDEAPEARDAFAVAGHLIGCYLSSRAGLKELGILRTERTLQGDFAEWLVAHLLDLELSRSTVEKHVDASDTSGRT